MADADMRSLKTRARCARPVSRTRMIAAPLRGKGSQTITRQSNDGRDVVERDEPGKRLSFRSIHVCWIATVFSNLKLACP
jgi:hypothetical protein